MQKTIAPFAANELRRQLGDAKFNAWMQKNGITPLDNATPQAGLASLLAPQQEPMNERPMQNLVPEASSVDGLAGLLPQVPKPGTFDTGGKGWQILGVIGDALQAVGGGQGTYIPSILAERQQEEEGRRRLAERQAERQQTLADWLWKQQYERDNPSPTGMENDLAAWLRMTPEQRATYAQMQDVRNPIAVSGPTGTFRVPRTYGQGGGIQTQTIGGKTYYNVNGEWYDNPEGR